MDIIRCPFGQYTNAHIRPHVQWRITLQCRYSTTMTFPAIRSLLVPTDDDDEVPVRTRRWLSVPMIACAIFACLMQVSLTARPQLDSPHGAIYVWYVFATFLAFAFPFILLMRSTRPESVFWISLAIVIVFPYDPLLMLMALTALVARRSSTARTIRAIAAAMPVAAWAQIRDALQPGNASFWHMLFAKPKTGVDGEPIVLLAEEPTIIATAAVVAIISVVVAALLGLHIRSRARLRQADAQTQAAQHHVQHLQSDLNSQKLVDAIAAEAHDTLAHSLSLIALNASALQAEANRLASHADSSTADSLASIVSTADELRRQSAGALDEAHAIIDMLRHPQQAWEQLAPSDDTSLTRNSLEALITDTRQTGVSVNTWIDIRQLDELDEATGKIAYRSIQEGLTNALRHAPGMPVSLEIKANPSDGIHIHVSNPVAAPPSTAPAAHLPAPSQSAASTSSEHSRRVGVGLSALTARVQAVGGTCRYGFDNRRIFHLDVTLPWHGDATALA